MGERPLLAKLATDALARERIPVPPPPSVEAEQRAIAVIGDAIESTRARRRRIIAAGVAAAAVAAAAIVGLGVTRHQPAPPTAVAPAARAFAIGDEARVIHDGSPHALVVEGPLFVHDRVATGEGSATIVMPRGSHLGIDPQSEVSIEEASSIERFSLSRGALRADVTKLRSGERFIVDTEDAEVEVRGTSFRVAVGEREARCGIETRTSVAVLEGTVWVRSNGNETILSAGQSWPSCSWAVASPAVKTAAPDKAVAPPSITTAPAVTTSSLPPVSTKNVPAPMSASDLAEQNRLFEDALAAKRRGDANAAIAGFEQVAARFPNGPLVESALAERMRLLGKERDPRARAAAEQYLARYPQGFARADARSILEP